MLKNKQGFTIVELLIVIVVIAIIAAITIVAFSGVQKQARNNAKISAATSIARALDANTIKTGAIVPGAPVCLPNGGADYNADGIPDCGAIDTASIRSEKAATNTFLTDNGVGKLGFPNDVVTGSNGARSTGVQITYGSTNRGINGVLQPYFLYFWLEGMNEDCKSSYSVTGTGSTDPLYMLDYGRNYGYSNGLTICAFTLKHTSSL